MLKAGDMAMHSRRLQLAGTRRCYLYESDGDVARASGFSTELLYLSQIGDALKASFEYETEKRSG
jgi:hypothetical protein